MEVVRELLPDKHFYCILLNVRDFQVIVVALTIQLCPTLGDFRGKNPPCYPIKYSFFQ